MKRAGTRDREVERARAALRRSVVVKGNIESLKRHFMPEGLMRMEEDLAKLAAFCDFAAAWVERACMREFSGEKLPRSVVDVATGVFLSQSERVDALRGDFDDAWMEVRSMCERLDELSEPDG